MAVGYLFRCTGQILNTFVDNWKFLLNSMSLCYAFPLRQALRSFILLTLLLGLAPGWGWAQRLEAGVSHTVAIHPDGTQYPRCEIVEKPVLFSHATIDAMSFYCMGIHEGKEDGTLVKNEQIAVDHIPTGEDMDHPWIITKDGILAQVQGRLRTIPL
jgi:hypothetical protein